MDASKAAETTESVGPNESAEIAEATETPLREGELRRRRKRRAVAALSVLLTIAIATPLAVHLAAGPRHSPRVQRHAPASGPVDVAEAARQAKKSGKDVEITAKRTANTTTWAQPDGLLRTRTYSDTIRAKVGNDWKKIDTTLQRVKGGYAPKAVNDPLLFSAGTGTAAKRASRDTPRTTLVVGTIANGSEADESWSQLVSLHTDGHDVVVSWPGPLPAPVVNGSRALYENIRPGIDLLLTARDSGYSHLLIVHNLQAAADPLLDDLNYRLSSPDLKFRMNADSHVVSAVDADGEEFATAPTPYLWDSAGEVKATIGEEPAATASASAPIPSPSTEHPTLTLPGLAGPQPGTHDRVLEATLATDNTLSLKVDKRLLNDADTVYPVFIDPSFKGHKRNWTLLYSKYPSSSFYNGQNFNDGTNEARVGYEADSGGLSRSVFTFDFDAKAHGSTVKEAWFYVNQTYSWGCSSRQYDLWITNSISGTNTWNNQPGWDHVINSATNGYGYRAGTCPDRWVKLDIKPEAQLAAKNQWGKLTMGLRAANESDTNAWKKFLANGESSPYIDVIYNHPPNEPLLSSMKLIPGSVCATGEVIPSVGKTDLTFTATGSDKDLNLEHVHLKIWPNDDAAHPVRNGDYTPNSSGTINVSVPWTSFTHGKTYTWTAWSIDTEDAVSALGPAGTNSLCQFSVDQNAPNSPTVESTDFPDPGDDGNIWSTLKFGSPGAVTFKPSGSSTDIKKYEYGVNSVSFSNPVTPGAGGIATVNVSPTHAGPNTLYVRAVDSAGNASAGTTYSFNVTPKAGLDLPGDITGDGFPDLLATSSTGNLLSYSADNRGDPHISTPGAHNNGVALEDGYWTDPATGKSALISHSTDWLPGDGITDLLARMPDGKLYLYPGDGYGSFDVSHRLDVLLPTGAPAPSTLTQLVATGDITGDGRPDALALAGQQLWAFTGYTGGRFADARLLATGTQWTTYDLVNVRDITGDNVADLLFRTADPDRGLLLRQGKSASGGGVDLASFATEAASATGHDVVYGTRGWARASYPTLLGTPDANGDTIPDFWAVGSDGALYFYPGQRATHGSRYLVGERSWDTLRALG
ncbi:DNRLRE domain-containing protein [Streptomyces sp. NBC_00210]|uniref:FG-GAP-like repeat-containing protein n=1 Tax=Streptomyces sp. NBC_00210 TaxID=2903636 RepID=UPI003254516D